MRTNTGRFIQSPNDNVFVIRQPQEDLRYAVLVATTGVQ